MKLENTLYCVIENQGGMSDVAQSYLNYFENNKSNDVLVILTENFARTASIYKQYEKKNIYFYYFENLFFLAHEKIRKHDQKIKKITKQHNIKRVLCDYMGFLFFENTDLKIVADIHYVMAMSNKISTIIPRSKKSQDFMFLAKKIEELSFRRSLLLKEKVERRLIERAQMVLVNSKTTGKNIRDMYDFVPNKKIVHICVARCLHRDQPFIKQKKQKQFLYHGRLNSIKGVQFLPEIHAHTKKRIKVIGANSKNKKIFTQKSAKGLRFIDWIDSPKELQNELDGALFHVFPSFYEPWGLALTKSMLSGAVCIANIVAGGHREQIAHGKNGFLIDFTQPDYLDKIIEIINMGDAKLNRIGRTAARAAKNQIARFKGDYVRLIHRQMTSL